MASTRRYSFFFKDPSIFDDARDLDGGFVDCGKNIQDNGL